MSRIEHAGRVTPSRSVAKTLEGLRMEKAAWRVGVVHAQAPLRERKKAGGRWLRRREAVMKRRKSAADVVEAVPTRREYLDVHTFIRKTLSTAASRERGLRKWRVARALWWMPLSIAPLDVGLGRVRIGSSAIGTCPLPTAHYPLPSTAHHEAPVHYSPPPPTTY
jgi:hypothetical protein